MKLVLCFKCMDIIKIIDIDRTCSCGNVVCSYIASSSDVKISSQENTHALLGFDRDSFIEAMTNSKFNLTPSKSGDFDFRAFVYNVNTLSIMTEEDYYDKQQGFGYS